MAFLSLSLISIGVVSSLLTIPLARLGRGFFSFHVGLALILEIIALALEPPRLASYGPFAVSLLLLLILFLLRKMRWTLDLLKLTAFLGALALGIHSAQAHTLSEAIARGLVLSTSALVLGSILVTMNLGHWYLVIKGLPFDLLGVANRYVVHALIGRVACIAAGALLLPDSWRRLFSPASGPIWDTALFLTVRGSFGLLGPFILAYLVHQCVKIKSNQSATGILYVSLVFILIGELSGLYFLIERGVPL